MPNPRKGDARGVRSDAQARRERAAVMLAGGDQIKDIAAELGVSANTVSKWLKEPDMARMVEEAKAEVRGDAMEILKGGAAAAAAALVEALEFGKTGEAIAAANSILDRIGIVKGQKIEHVDSELAKLSDEELADELEAEAKRLRGEE